MRPRPSLLERAADVYDFGAAMRARDGEMPESAPAPVLEPLAVEQPVEPARTPPAAAPFVAAAPVEVTPTPAVEPEAPPYRPAGPIEAVDVDGLREGGYIVPDAPVSALSEEFRIVKRQLLLAAFGGQGTDPIENGRVILVSSAQPNEGKTWCAVNLALSMAAERDIDIVLVDADFAKPEILSTLGLPGGPGIIDGLEDPSIDLEACIIRTDIRNLSVLPAGKTSNATSELLAAGRSRRLLDALLAGHPRRVVIFDSPPALAASVASELSLHAGQLLMVVRADRTSEAELREAVLMLGHCPNIQLMLNAVEFAQSGRRFGSYYGYGS